MSITESTHALGDRVKITNEMHEYHNQIGEVAFTTATHVWVRFPSSPLAACSFKNESVTKLKNPEKGDRVRVLQPGRWQAHEGTVSSVYDKVVNVLLDEDQTSPARLHVKEVEVFDAAPIERRVEGEAILFEHVKKGDLIETLSFREKSGVKQKTYTEGVVDAVSLRVPLLKNRAGVDIYDARIHTGIKLLKAVGNDEVLTALKGFPVGAILSYYESGEPSPYRLRVAVKRSDSHWGQLVGTAGQMIRTATLRESLKEAGDSYTILDGGE